MVNKNVIDTPKLCFLIAPCKDIALNLFCLTFSISYLIYFIAFKIETNNNYCYHKRLKRITIQRAIQKIINIQKQNKFLEQ